MDGYSVVKEICDKISAAANQIVEYEKSIDRFQAYGASDTFTEVQELILEQLQKLTLQLTGILIPEQEEEFENNLDEVEGGSVFMPGELDDKKPPIEVEYPEETIDG